MADEIWEDISVVIFIKVLVRSAEKIYDSFKNSFHLLKFSTQLPFSISTDSCQTTRSFSRKLKILTFFIHYKNNSACYSYSKALKLILREHVLFHVYNRRRLLQSKMADSMIDYIDLHHFWLSKHEWMYRV